MIKINILTPQNKYTKGFYDFYPLLKWKDNFLKEGIKFSFFKSHLNPNLRNANILIIDSRYPEMILKGHYKVDVKQNYSDDSFIIDFINESRKFVDKIILFDNNDDAGSISLHITPFVDIHLKKQLFSDVKKYNELEEYNLMPWLPKGENITERKNKKIKYSVLNPSENHKLRLGWNIGMCDYRKLPFKKLLPMGTNPFFNNLYNHLDIKEPSINRDLLLSYRGSSNRFPSYDYQRNLVMNELEKLNNYNAIVGGKVPFEEYMKEQENSKISVSPYGWGEICYRDFESILNGCLLLKPNMNHLATYPNFYTKETYVPFSWDCSDLLSTIESVKENYSDYMQIITNAQSLFKRSQSDSKSFIEHFKKNILD